MNRKRILTVAGCVMLICLTVWLNAALSGSKKEREASAPAPSQTPEVQPELAGAEEDYFAVFRQERDSVREKEMEYLDGIVTAEGTDKETLAQAQSQRLALIDSMEKEVTVEGLIRAKGFSEAAVTVHNGSVSVVVDREALTDAEVAQILDIVRRETGESAENIKVMPLS